jgi:hypothetical protein
MQHAVALVGRFINALTHRLPAWGADLSSALSLLFHRQRAESRRVPGTSGAPRRLSGRVEGGVRPSEVPAAVWPKSRPMKLIPARPPVPTLPLTPPWYLRATSVLPPLHLRFGHGGRPEVARRYYGGTTEVSARGWLAGALRVVGHCREMRQGLEHGSRRLLAKNPLGIRSHRHLDERMNIGDQR